MKKDDKISELIKSLVLLTRQMEISWYTLPEYLEKNRNEILRRYLITENQYYGTPHDNGQFLSEYHSYCTKINSSIAYFFQFYDNSSNEFYFILGLQNNDSSNIIMMNSRSSYQNDMMALSFHIKNRNDNIDSLVDSIISKANSNI